MVYEQIPPDVDLMEFMERQAFKPVRYKHLKRGTTYLVISDGEYHLNEFSEEGSLHEFFYQGRKVICTFQFSGGAGDEPHRYAGDIVIYVGEDGNFWMRPKFEFHDGRFVRIDE